MPKRPPSPTTLVLVRHATTTTTGKILPGRAAGLHLSESGRDEAAATAKALASLDKVAALYSSPLERARETAAAISQVSGIRTVIDRGLIECDFGEWTGKELKALAKLPEWQTVQQRPSAFRFPEGESFLEMSTRIVETLSTLTARHRGETVIAVSHADPIKAALAHYLGMHLDTFQRLIVAPASVSVVIDSASGIVVPEISRISPPLPADPDEAKTP